MDLFVKICRAGSLLQFLGKIALWAGKHQVVLSQLPSGLGNIGLQEEIGRVYFAQSAGKEDIRRRARAESMPNLIVRAEDVSAEHGATVGELDKEALYFLMARGIPENEARSLLIEGFINSVLQNVPGESLQEELDARLKGRLI